MCGAYVSHYVDNELWEGKSPPDSGCLTVRGLFYRVHEIPCPLCGAFIMTPFTDIQAAFGKKLQCGTCKYERVYLWPGPQEER